MIHTVNGFGIVNKAEIELEVIKQEMAGMNVDILGISELKWTGIGEFNSDDHYIYYCGEESHLEGTWVRRSHLVMSGGHPAPAMTPRRWLMLDPSVSAALHVFSFSLQ